MVRMLVTLRNCCLLLLALLCVPFATMACQVDILRPTPPLGSADAIATVLGEFNRQHTLGFGTPTVVQLRSDPNTLILAAASVEPEGYQAFRLWLLRKQGPELAVIDRSEHMGDASRLTPQVFEQSGNVLVLADPSDEYSSGLLAFIVRGDSLVQQDFPAVSVVNSERLPDLMGPGESALPFIEVSWDAGGWRVQAETDFVVAPGTTQQRLLCRDGTEPVVIQQDAGQWVVRGATFRSSESMDTNSWLC